MHHTCNHACGLSPEKHVICIWFQSCWVAIFWFKEPCTCNSFPVCLFYLYSFCKKYLNRIISFSCYGVQYLMMLWMILFKINQFSLFIFFFLERGIGFPSILVWNFNTPGHDIMKHNKSVQWFAFEARYTGRLTMSFT